MTTARDQFVNDYTLVIDNDFTAWSEVMDVVRSKDRNLVVVSEELREQFEAYISEVADREEQLGNQVGALLIQQLLLNWGSDAFDDIARHYIGKDSE